LVDRHSRERGNSEKVAVAEQFYHNHMMDSRVYLIVRDDHAGVDGNLVPRMCPALRWVHPCGTDEPKRTSVAPEAIAGLSYSVVNDESWQFAWMTNFPHLRVP
jgi:hypothetical protein